jgi:hypothetical protein
MILENLIILFPLYKETHMIKWMMRLEHVLSLRKNLNY